MPIVATRVREESPQSTSKGYALTELWEVWFDDGTGQYNLNGYVNPKDAVDDSGIPKIYDPHPTFGAPFGNPQVVDKAVVQVVANWSVLVKVYYRSWGLYSGGPRNTVSAYNSVRHIELPVWHSFTDGVVVGWARKDPCPLYRRMVLLRNETRFVPGNAVTAVSDAIAANIGTVWTIGGRFYLLSDRSSAQYDGRLYTRVNYVFEHDCAIPAIPAGSSWGNDAAIPALPPLYTWSDRPNSMSSAIPPTITANYPPAVFGGPPAFPALPNYP